MSQQRLDPVCLGQGLDQLEHCRAVDVRLDHLGQRPEFLFQRFLAERPGRRASHTDPTLLKRYDFLFLFCAFFASCCAFLMALV